MGRFRIDDPAIDVEELEARVAASIERKRGTRFTDRELEELRTMPMRPRLRREDLPRGLMDELSRVRARLPEVPVVPDAVSVSTTQTKDAKLQSAGVKGLNAGEELYATGSGGVKGLVLRVLRRLARPLFRATINLEAVLGRLVVQDQYAERRFETGFDLLKDNLEARVDATADWIGEHVSELSGQLEKRQERQLHLMHNLVYEFTNARLDLEQMQDRINELTRRLEALAARERALEEMTLGSGT